MIEVRYVQINDRDFWYRYDKHLPGQEFENKVKDKKGYILLEDYQPIGLLRYNLFGDNIPFCTMIYIDQNFQKRVMEQNWLNIGKQKWDQKVMAWF